MARIIEIDSLDLPELAMFSRLTENQLRNRKEPEKGIFIAESPKVIRRALAAGLLVLCCLCTALAQKALPTAAKTTDRHKENSTTASSYC